MTPGTRTRLLTALLIAPPSVCAAWLLPTWLVGLIWATVLARAAWEWGHLSVERAPVRAVWGACVVAGFTLLAVVAEDHGASNALLGLAVAFWTAAAVLLVLAERGRVGPLPESFTMTAGAVAIWASWLALVRVHDGPEGPLRVLLLFALVWIADSLAYFVGRLVGGPRLSPRVSPGKTLSGLTAGLASALLVGLMSLPLLPAAVSNPGGHLLLCALTVSYSVVGDLLESLLKRMAGTKDSGTLLPGHGGLLDRIDSLLAAAPVYACGSALLTGNA